MFAGESLFRFEPEEISEQVVIAVPGAGAVEPDQELVAACRVGEPLCATGAVGDGVDERAVELLQHGGLEQASPLFLALPGEELVGHVVDDELVVPMERLDESFGVSRVVQRQPGEHEAGGPPFGAATQSFDDALVEELALVVDEEAGGFGCLESEVVAPDLGQLFSDPQPTEPERRIDPGRHDDRDGRRTELDQALHAAMHRRMVDQVVVVDHDDQRLGEVGELVDHGRDEHLLVAVRTVHELFERAGHRWNRFGDGCDQVGPVPGRIRVAVLDLQPGGGLGAPRQPRREERRLAGSGRGAGEHQPGSACQTGIEPIAQTRPLNQPVRQRRWNQLRRCQSAAQLPGHGVDPTSPAKRSS